LVPHKIVIGLTFKSCKFLNPLKFSKEMFSNIFFYFNFFLQFSLVYPIHPTSPTILVGQASSSPWSGFSFLCLFIPTKSRSQTAPLPPSSSNKDRVARPFLPREQLFPKHRVLLESNARSLSVSDAQEQVRALARRRLQVLTINS